MNDEAALTTKLNLIFRDIFKKTGYRPPYNRSLRHRILLPAKIFIIVITALMMCDRILPIFFLEDESCMVREQLQLFDNTSVFVLSDCSWDSTGTVFFVQYPILYVINDTVCVTDDEVLRHNGSISSLIIRPVNSTTACKVTVIRSKNTQLRFYEGPNRIDELQALLLLIVELLLDLSTCILCLFLVDKVEQCTRLEYEEETLTGVYYY